MSNKGPATVNPAVRSAYDARKAISCLSFHGELRLAAVGSQADVKVLRVDKYGAIADVCSKPSSAPRTLVTDVAWGVGDCQHLAAAYNSGEIHCFSLGTASTKLDAVWSFKTENAVNKISWHPREPFFLASADNKGNLRLHDTRDSAESATIACRFIQNQSKNTKDIQFNFFNSDLFAAVADNHASVRVWDRRNLRSHVMESATKDFSHRLGVTSIAWSTVDEYILATGSLDKTVKVWDAGKCAVPYPFAPMTGSGGHAAEPVLVQTLNTNAEVTKVAWSQDGNRRAFLTTLSQNATTSGNVYLWEKKHPNVPLCVLGGHGRDTCTAFQWINIEDHNSTGTTLSSSTSSSKKSNGRNKKRSKDTTDNAPPPCNYLLTAGKDGRLLIQDPHKGFFPYEKISPAVTAISSQGHVCFHNSSLGAPKLSFQGNGSDLGGGAGAGGSDKLRHAPSSSSAPFLSSLATPSVLTSSSVATSLATSPSSPSALALGSLVVGQVEFTGLEHVHSVRRRQNAEASAFDPALICLLATHYTLPHFVFTEPFAHSDTVFITPSGEKSSTTTLTTISTAATASVDAGDIPGDLVITSAMQSYRAAMESCQSNYLTAVQAGLQCRAAVWASLLALLPHPRARNATATLMLPPPRSASPSPTPSSSSSSSALVSSFGSDSEVPFAKELIASLLKDLLEAGDSQHFVILCEILRHVYVHSDSSADLAAYASPSQSPSFLYSMWSLANISDQAIRRSYLSYIDLLMKLQLYCKATEIVNGIDDNALIVSLQKDIDFAIKCTKCRKELAKRDPLARHAPVWCSNCRKCASLCSYCNEPCEGMMQWCPVCCHGGHYECMTRWFRQYNTCPTGCMHSCCPSPPSGLSWADGIRHTGMQAAGYDYCYADVRKAARQKGQRARQLAGRVFVRIQALSS